MKDKQKDFLLIREVINKNFAVLVFAILTSMIGMVVDGIFIGRFLGSEQIAAYGIVGPVFVLFSAIAGVFQSGAQAQCAQYMGKGCILCQHTETEQPDHQAERRETKP